MLMQLSSIIIFLLEYCTGEARAQFLIAAVKAKTMLYAAGVRHPSNLPNHL